MKRLSSKLLIAAVLTALFADITAAASVQRFNFDTEDPNAVYEATEASGQCGENITWRVSGDGTLTISGTGAMNYCADSSQVPWFAATDSKSLVKIKFEGNVESIANAAFHNTRIKEIRLPQSVTSLGKHSLSLCKKLKTVVLPDAVEVLPEYILSGNPALEYVHLPEKLKIIEKNALINCDALTEVIIPNGVTSIGELAFSNCYSLKRVVLPEQLVEIGPHAFEICDALGEVYFPNGLKRIDADAFANCFSLEKIILPDGLESIGDSAFELGDESKPHIVYIPKSVKEIGRRAIDENTATIYGFKGSYAEEYAKNNDIPFMEVTESMYSEDEYNKAVAAQVDNIPDAEAEAAASVLYVKSDGAAVSVTADGKEVNFDDAEPFVDENGRTQIPVRSVAEVMDCAVDWNETDRTVTLTKGDNIVKISIGSAEMTVGDKTVTMDTAARIVNDRTYIPVRYAGEALGLEVNWVE